MSEKEIDAIVHMLLNAFEEIQFMHEGELDQVIDKAKAWGYNVSLSTNEVLSVSEVKD